MRRITRSRPFAHLALLAMLLLALLPTTGRLYRNAHGDDRALAALGDDSGFGTICSARGLIVDAALAAREAAAFGEFRSFDGSDSGTPTPHADDDCDYCNLSGSTALSAALLCPPHVELANAPTPRIIDSGPLSSFVHGLGARGPPNV